MIVVSIGGVANDGTNYEMYLDQPFTQPSVKLETVSRTNAAPVITNVQSNVMLMNLDITVYGATEATTKALRETLLAALDTISAAVMLVVSDDDGSNDRYRYVVVQSVDEQPEENGIGGHLVATLVTHDEVHWRSTTPTSITWNATASAETLAVSNTGALPARPTYTIKPTAAKAAPPNAFIYKSFCAVTWSGKAATFYPVDITSNGPSAAAEWDTDALVTAGKISAETNIAVMVDGVLRRRWIANYDTTSTSVWTNLDFVEYEASTLLSNMGAGDTISTLSAIDSIDSYPPSGTLMIGSEVFTYTSRDKGARTFSGVIRAARGSTAAGHTAADTIHWLQHDIWVLYGGTGSWVNTSDLIGPAPVGESTNANIYKPMFELTGTLTQSSNYNWNYTHFGQSSTSGNWYRSASWWPTLQTVFAVERSTSDTTLWDAIIARSRDYTSLNGPGWSLALAYPITLLIAFGESTDYKPQYPWESGFYIGNDVLDNELYVSITRPTGPVGEAQSYRATGAEATTVGNLFFQTRSQLDDVKRSTLDSLQLYFTDEYPRVTVGDEQSMYDLALTLANVTTGHSIDLTLPMVVDGQLEVDTADHTVILLDDLSNQYQALSRSTRRMEILTLAPGTNTLRVTETGLQGVTVYISFDVRSYG